MLLFESTFLSGEGKLVVRQWQSAIRIAYSVEFRRSYPRASSRL